MRRTAEKQEAARKRKRLPVSYICGGDSELVLSNQEITFH